MMGSGMVKNIRNYKRALSTKTERTSTKAATITAGAARKAESTTKGGAAERSTTPKAASSKAKRATTASTKTKEAETISHTDGGGQNDYNLCIFVKEV